MKKKASHAEWIAEKSRERAVKCWTCTDPARADLVLLLEAAKNVPPRSITVEKLYEGVETFAPGFQSRVGFDAFRKHLAAHEPLWHRAKVKA